MPKTKKRFSEKRAVCLICLMGAVLSGCRTETKVMEGLTSVRLTVRYDEAMELDQLHITLSVGTSPLLDPTVLPTSPSETLASGSESVVFVFPDGDASLTVRFRVDGLRGGMVAASGQGSITLVLKELVDLEVILGAAAICGDGVIQEHVELCDDENDHDDDGCSSLCLVEPGWICVGTPSICSFTCGNGLIDSNEGCDDGNLFAEDGCSVYCQVEPGWICSDEPSVCHPCGDGVLDPNEECDDSNNDDEDGCSALCKVEPFSACSGEPSSCVRVAFVDKDPVAGTRDGSSWGTAFATVQEGIDQAVVRGGCEVWVAEGVYRIYQSSASDTLQLRSSVPVYGGFSGGETARSQRDWSANPGVLDGSEENEPMNRVEHVVTAVGTVDATLDGFVIRNGEALQNGGGVYLEQSSVTVANCRFQGNTAVANGGGLFSSVSKVEIDRCDFVANGANGKGGGLFVDGGTALVSSSYFLSNNANDGGGAYLADLEEGSQIIGCSFEDNSAALRGGGLAVEGGDPLIRLCLFERNDAEHGGGANLLGTEGTVGECQFLENVAADRGGGMQAENGYVVILDSLFRENDSAQGGGLDVLDGDSDVVRCRFESNYATSWAGGVFHTGGNHLIANTVFFANISMRGGGTDTAYDAVAIYINDTFHANQATEGLGFGGGLRTYQAQSFVFNTILWGDLPEEICVTAGGVIQISYSDVEGGYTGAGNIDEPPLFMDGANGDLHLLPGSPCIDAADGDHAPQDDMEGNTRIDDQETANTGAGNPDFADMGAYEYQP